jgi:hypothetical protein
MTNVFKTRPWKAGSGGVAWIRNRGKETRFRRPQGAVRALESYVFSGIDLPQDGILEVVVKSMVQSGLASRPRALSRPAAPAVSASRNDRNASRVRVYEIDA